MGRPKTFTRQALLEKGAAGFWRQGFADASLHELEQATGVNKSGLYAEFKDKEDLFVQSLRYYLESLEKQGLPPSPWAGITSSDSSSWDHALCADRRDVSRSTPFGSAQYCRRNRSGIITRSRSKIKQLLAKNIEAERPKMNHESLAELVLTFFTGLSMEQNLSSSRRSIDRNIDDLMSIVRTL